MNSVSAISITSPPASAIAVAYGRLDIVEGMPYACSLAGSTVTWYCLT